MALYYTSTRNPIARAGVIRALMARGYKLSCNLTVSDYFTKWPAEEFPVVVVGTLRHLIQGSSLIIDLDDGDFRDIRYADEDDISYFSPVTFEGLPTANELLRNMPLSQSPVEAMVFPSAAKYNVSYEKCNGKVANYVISNPIEASTDSITAHAFGRGVRTFKKCRVRGFSRVS